MFDEIAILEADWGFKPICRCKPPAPQPIVYYIVTSDPLPPLVYKKFPLRDRGAARIRVFYFSG
jgi:hypothetical protein